MTHKYIDKVRLLSQWFERLLISYDEPGSIITFNCPIRRIQKLLEDLSSDNCVSAEVLIVNSAPLIVRIVFSSDYLLFPFWCPLHHRTNYGRIVLAENSASSPQLLR